MSAATYRRPGSEARRVRNLVFDRLPTVVRERLVTSLAGGGAPAPLLIDASWHSPPSALRWRLVAAAAVVVEAFLWFKGFGDATSPLALLPLRYAAAHGAAIFTLLFALIRAARIARGQGGAPVPEGRYLFALDLVEVEGRQLRVTDLHTLRRAEARQGKRASSIVLVFADEHEVTFEAQPRAESLAASVKAAVDAALALSFTDDQPVISRLDPFFELRVSDDWASAEADPKERRSLLLRAPLPALSAAILVLAALAGPGLHALRNRLSDDEMFVQAIEIAERRNDPHLWKIGAYTGVRHVDEIDSIRFERANRTGVDEDALKDYLLHAGAHRRDAEAALFAIWKRDPASLAAEIRRGGAFAVQAEAALYELNSGDLDALVDYIKKRGPRADQADDQLFALAQKSGEPKSYRFYLKHGKRHIDQVQSTLLPEAAYLDAKTKDEVDVLGVFVREYPDSAHAEEARAKIHALYEDALRAYRAKKPSAAGLRFVTALLAELEDRADPSVSVEVAFHESDALAPADARLASRIGADYVPAARWVAGWELGVMERRLRDDLTWWIISSFANGTVRIAAPDVNVDAGRPRIVVTCESVAEGALRVPRAKLALLDLRFRVDLHAVIPARATALSWTYTTPSAKLSDAPGAVLVDPDRFDQADAAYAGMKTEATTQILERIKRDL